jgi:hypothetical protein
MREIESKKRGHGRVTRRAAAVLSLGPAVVLAVTQWACGNGPVDPDLPSAPAAASVGGTWSGGSGSLHLVWSLRQQGESVTGSSAVSDGSGWTSGAGQLTGTITGSSFTFTDTHPAGTSTPEGCAAVFEGTLEVAVVPEPMATPTPYYPYTSLPSPPPESMRSAMSGLVSGSNCRGPISAMVTILRD